MNSLLMLLSGLLAAFLLCMGAEVLELAQQRLRQQWPAARLVAAMLMGAGLWWPLQALADRAGVAGVEAGLGRLMPMLALGLALAAAELMCEAVRPQRARLMQSRGMLAIFAIALAGLQAWLAGPEFGPNWLLKLKAVGASTLLQMGLLALLMRQRGEGLSGRAARIGCALAAAGLPLLAWAEWGPVSMLTVGADALPLALALMIAATVGGLLLAPLRRQSAADVEPSVRPPAPLTDPLTGLFTRLGLEDNLAQAVIASDRSEAPLALLMFDLDGFNPVNSSLGHDNGDALLRQVADRLRACLEPEDVAARIGGDEFVVLLRAPADQDAIADFARRALAALAKPYLLEQRELTLSCSVGIARYPRDGGKARMLVCADAAKSAAKRMGGACYCFYAQGMDGDTREQLDLLRDLRLAIERQELALFYQPKIDARSGQITAAEALLRWHHPTRGLVSPVVFIPIAERFGFMRELGNWVIVEACRQSRVWRESGLRMRVAINLSAHQMRQADLVERIADALHENRVHPSLLTCEITESVVMENTQAIQDTFKRLGELGVHLSIDDFGTGYSSLSYLRQLPAKELKIDRAFIIDICASVDARAVVDAVIKLAHALGLRVVAEGVETQGQQAILCGMGCDELQGFLFARPMSAQAILLWAIDDQQAAPAFRASLFGDTSFIEKL
ncbi:MAG: bifunctional diguanylate cyclase/phosphodiesterase [Paucibacter sp.]|nr:bifunctional diguanylate cyclase/phosphodiesterase [Roseateles sp.]